MNPSSAGALITLLDPVVFPVEAANTGRRRTLSHIPGAALLGAAAQAYGAFGEAAFDAFHSGALRFGDGLPVNAAGEIGWPAPLCLHRNAEGAPLFNHPWRFDPDAEPPAGKPERVQTVTEGGEALKIKTLASLKTAIDPRTKRAAQAQLFGYQALAAGQRFYAEISAEDPALLAQLKAHLPEGRIRLGRSKSAEYGRAELRWIAPQPSPARRDPQKGDLILWALSDLALDPEEPNLAKLLKLKGASFEPSRSFTRSRRVWPWNAAWGGRGLERLVLERGSVLVFSGAQAPEGDAMRGGLHQELGCGWLAVNPAMLAATAPELAKLPHVALRKQDKLTTKAAGEARIHKILSTRIGAQKNEDRRGEELRTIMKDIRAFYEAAARLAGSDPARIGPSPAQWGAVRAAATPMGGKTATAADLFGDKAPAKLGDADWGLRRWNDETKRYESFRDWLAEQAGADLNRLDAPLADPERVALLAKRAAEQISRMREGA